MTCFITFLNANLIIILFGYTQFSLIVHLKSNELIIDHVNLQPVPSKAKGKVLDTLCKVYLKIIDLIKNEALAHIVFGVTLDRFETHSEESQGKNDLDNGAETSTCSFDFFFSIQIHLQTRGELVPIFHSLIQFRNIFHLIPILKIMLYLLDKCKKDLITC